MKRKSAVSALEGANSTRKAQKSDSDTPGYEANSDGEENGELSFVEGEEHFDVPATNEGEGENLVKISRFEPNDKNTVSMGSEVVYGMKKGETIVCRGQYKLSVLKGAIRLMGATIHAHPERYHVHALPSHSLPVIECIQVENLDLVEETVIPDTEHLFDEYRAIVRLEPASCGIESVAEVAPVFKNLANTSGTGTFELLTKGPESTRLFTSFKTWYDTAYKLLAAMDDSDKPPVMMVTGPKSSGKSTFSRFLNNFLNSKIDGVYYLELDPGQPEYCIPGTLSLSFTSFNFGLPYTHHPRDNKTIIKAHALGDLSPKDQPGSYLSFANDLLRVYQTQLTTRPAPLIINTPGWARGLGLDLTVQIANDGQLSHVIYLGSQEGQDTMRQALSSVPSFFAPENALTQSWTSKYSSPDLRTLQTISYFHSLNFNQHLTEIPPYSASYVSSEIKGFHVQKDEGILPEDMDICFNGTVVHIVEVEENVYIETKESTDLPLLKTPQVALDPATSKCLGYAIVQSLDKDNQQIRLLTPIDVSGLKKKSLVLVRGRLQIPLWILWNHKMAKTQSDAPYLSKSGTVGAGSATQKVRRNIQRGN
jgi:polynucleotide 5'-hydroxyl-kinase GRC3/NOL9